MPIDNSEASIIQSALTKKMKEAEHILIIIGERSHTSKWVKWEIERAKQRDTNLKFAAVKIKSSNQNPPGLPLNTAVADEFKLDKIVAALNNAKRNV